MKGQGLSISTVSLQAITAGKMVGMQNQAFSFPMFDAQAMWSLSYILGDIKIPTKDEMVKDVRKWTDR